MGWRDWSDEKKARYYSRRKMRRAVDGEGMNEETKARLVAMRRAKVQETHASRHDAAAEQRQMREHETWRPGMAFTSELAHSRDAGDGTVSTGSRCPHCRAECVWDVAVEAGRRYAKAERCPRCGWRIEFEAAA